MATQKKPAKKAASKPAKKAGASAKKAPAKKAASKKAAAKKATAKKTAASTSTTTKKTTKKAAVKKKPAKSPFGKKFLDAQEKKLLEERERYVNSALTWKAEADSLLVDREPGDVQFDEESGDGDTLQIERERDLALSSHARAAVEEIDEALARLKAGVYGVCITSGKPIPKERLEVLPWAAERVEYKVAGFRRK